MPQITVLRCYTLEEEAKYRAIFYLRNYNVFDVMHYVKDALSKELKDNNIHFEKLSSKDRRDIQLFKLLQMVVLQNDKVIKEFDAWYQRLTHKSKIPTRKRRILICGLYDVQQLDNIVERLKSYIEFKIITSREIDNNEGNIHKYIDNVTSMEQY